MSRQDDLRELIETNKPLNKKQTILRFAAFLIFLAIGVTFITLGVTSIGKRDEGLQTISAAQDPEVPYYQNGVSFQHWFSGSSSEIRRGVQELEELYAGALKDAHRLLDPVNSYEGWANLATLNQNLGRTVMVNRELYEVLEDALRLSEREEGYNLFSGVLWSEWESLRYALEPADFDPANDPDEAERLARLTAATAERSNFSLELLDPELCQVRFTVDQRYLDLLAELELEELPILNLNVLYEAYKLRLTAARLEARGYDRGYLLTDSGLLLALSAYEDGGEFCLYGQRDGEALPAATVPITPGVCIVQLRAFGFSEEPGYYALETAAGETLLRHPWLPADGQFRELLLSAFVAGEDMTAPEAVYACLRFCACDTEGELFALAKSLPESAALLLRSDPATVYVNDRALTAYPDSGCTVKPVPAQ